MSDPCFGADPQGFQIQEELDAFIALIEAEIVRLGEKRKARAEKDSRPASVLPKQMSLGI